MRFIARFCIELDDSFEVTTVFDKDIQKIKIDKDNPKIKSIATLYPAATWFERKIKDDFGIMIENAFDNRVLIHHERFPNIHPMRKNFKDTRIEFTDFKPYKYEVIRGDGVFEVAVGPIHAGIIEPGHFQFSQAGERMLHLEVRHFYKYRAIEKMLEGKNLFEAKDIIERISGNESIAYQIAWFKILEQATELEYEEELKKYHALLLELERIEHHLVDLGFIPSDAGFGAAIAFCSELSEKTRRVLKSITGHRFGFGSIGFEAKEFNKKKLYEFLTTLKNEMIWFENWIIDVPSLWDRFDTTGVLTKQKAIKYSSVGVMSKASGLKIDRRTDEFYKKYGFIMQTQTSGDVGARFKLRIQEIFNSIDMMHKMMGKPVSVQKPEFIKDGEYLSFVESSLGELFMFIKIRDGKIDRFFSRDPSFVNWQALYLLMSKDIIADFPLINKSCDLSYAGNDL